MDLDELRMILSRSEVDVWGLIETAITVASLDFADELKQRRDKIVEKLYSSPPPPAASSSSNLLCRNCHDPIETRQRQSGTNHNTNNTKDYSNNINSNNHYSSSNMKSSSPLTPDSDHLVNVVGGEDREEEEMDPYGGLFDDEQTKILRIKEHLEDPDQSEEDVVELLQSLADMDITFKALKETDIGRHVNRLRKHPSDEVRRLVKQLVKKWKETVDEWVRLNQPEQASENLIADGESPLQNIQRNQHNGHSHQVPDFGYSPNPQNGSSNSDRNHLESDNKQKSLPSRKDGQGPSRPPHSAPQSAPPASRPQKESNIDLEKLNSARRRLQENYQEAQNAKKQRTIQMMDINEIPKPRNAFFAKNKGNSRGRQHR